MDYEPRHDVTTRAGLEAERALLDAALSKREITQNQWHARTLQVCRAWRRANPPARGWEADRRENLRVAARLRDPDLDASSRLMAELELLARQWRLNCCTQREMCSFLDEARRSQPSEVEARWRRLGGEDLKHFDAVLAALKGELKQ
ncbi:MAG: hypothetical protein WAU58_19740 [Terriglobales bacterium]